ncbi:hypothetical protein GCM10009744_49680 [Kribbella alba]|uniref:Uncharacterized protein n=1 Tax=Kribbella alba TaxID=190197 RepID=A0ABP4RI13_9ACTN
MLLPVEPTQCAAPMDSLTIHGNSPCATRVPPTTRGLGSPWAEVVRALAEGAGTMTRAAVIAPKKAVLRAVAHRCLLIGLTMELHSLYTLQHSR